MLLCYLCVLRYQQQEQQQRQQAGGTLGIGADFGGVRRRSHVSEVGTEYRHTVYLSVSRGGSVVAEVQSCFALMASQQWKVQTSTPITNTGSPEKPNVIL